MSEFIASGRVVDLALLLIALELLVLTVYRWRTGGGAALPDVMPALIAGVCLLLALRFALTDASPLWIALAMGAALPAHLFDLRRRSRYPA